MQDFSKRLSKPALERTLREKGWTIQDAAQFLDVSRQYLYSNFADPGHPRLLDCAILGLPHCTPELAMELKAVRDELKRQRAKTASPPKVCPGSNPEHEGTVGILEVGAGVSAIKYVGDLVEEGAEGWVRRVFRVGSTVTYSIEFPGVGAEDFPEAMLQEFFVENGKIEQF